LREDVRIEHEIHIERDPAEAFAFLSGPEKLAAWQPATVGERFERAHKAFGRELSSTQLRFVGEAGVRRPMRLAKPVFARQFRGYHERLKDLLEDTTSR
jgi:hypothetical protein